MVCYVYHNKKLEYLRYVCMYMCIHIPAQCIFKRIKSYPSAWMHIMTWEPLNRLLLDLILESLMTNRHAILVSLEIGQNEPAL